MSKVKQTQIEGATLSEIAILQKLRELNAISEKMEALNTMAAMTLKSVRKDMNQLMIAYRKMVMNKERQ